MARRRRLTSRPGITILVLLPKSPYKLARHRNRFVPVRPHIRFRRIPRRGSGLGGHRDLFRAPRREVRDGRGVAVRRRRWRTQKSCCLPSGVAGSAAPSSSSMIGASVHGGPEHREERGPSLGELDALKSTSWSSACRLCALPIFCDTSNGCEQSRRGVSFRRINGVVWYPRAGRSRNERPEYM